MDAGLASFWNRRASALGGRVEVVLQGEQPLCDFLWFWRPSSCGGDPKVSREDAKTRRGRGGRESCEGRFLVDGVPCGGEARQGVGRAGSGSKGLLSPLPGLVIHGGTEPTADAVGYLLSALRA